MSKLLLIALLAALLGHARAENLTVTPPSAGQFPGTANGTAASAGNVGEYKSLTVQNSAVTATVSFTNATPTVVTWTAHGFTTGAAVYFTGTVPTGVTASLTYYVNIIDANNFHIATTVANAFAGSYVATSSTGTTPTGIAGATISSGNAVDIGGLNLTAGNWLVGGNVYFTAASGTVPTLIGAWVSSTAATLPAVPLYNDLSATLTTSGTNSISTPTIRISQSSTTPVSLSANGLFTVSTMNFSGTIWALRTN